VLYLTDTGRSWDNENYSVRDKIVIKDVERSEIPRAQRSGGSDVSVRDKVVSRQYEESRKKSEVRCQKSDVRSQRTERLGDLETKRQSDKEKQSGSDLHTLRAQGLQEKYRFRRTQDIIDAAYADKLPEKIMLTVHPQRWSDSFLPWARELVWQNVKNIVKWGVVKIKD